MNGYRSRRLAALGAAVLTFAGACVGGGGISDTERDRIDPLIISSGGVVGVYHSYSEAIAETLSDELAVTAAVESTGGSVENLNRLAEGKATLAFSAADAATNATTGTNPFDEPLPLQALARLYDDFVHLVVDESSDIETIDDLRGRTVSLGAEGSGTDLIATRLLRIAGLAPASIDPVSLGLDASIAALQTGEIEAFFWSGGLPTPGLAELTAGYPIRLIPLEDIAEDANARYRGGYRAGVIPEGTYGLTEDVDTIAIPNFLMVRDDLPDDVAYEIVKILFEQRPQIADRAPAAGLLDRPRSIFTKPVGLHPGALRYYRGTKS